MLRYMAWLCFQITKNSKFSNPQMCIVTGPRIELAITLIEWMKQLFYSENLVIQDTKFDSKVTVIELNGVHIEAVPIASLGRNERTQRCGIYLLR